MNNIRYPENTQVSDLLKSFDSYRFLAGINAMQISNHTVSESMNDLARQYDVSRKTVWEYRKNAEDILYQLEQLSFYDANAVILNQPMIQKTILSLALDCHATEEGILRFIKAIYGVNISIGYVSKVLNKAAKEAEQIDAEIGLSSVKQGANDEIFQANDKPVFTGIDLDSTYIYLLEQMDDRKGETWFEVMEYLKMFGLKLEVSVNDAGSGLLYGIKKAFPDIRIQIDVFHTLKELGEMVCTFERYVYSRIEDQYNWIKATSGKKVHKKTLAKLEIVNQELPQPMKEYDDIVTLYGWLKELIDFSGYSAEVCTEHLHWILDEMVSILKDHSTFKRWKKFLNKIEVFRDRIPAIMVFLYRTFEEFEKAANEINISIEVFKLLYQRLALNPASEEYRKNEKILYRLLGEDKEKVEQVYMSILKGIKRASSLIENLNGRLRAYMNIKRLVPNRFLTLLKVYLNHKKYRRSRIAERKGKSPIELMTGKSHPEFIELLDQRGFFAQA